MENEGKITGVFWVRLDQNLDWRICYQIAYPDGFADYIPVDEFKTGNDVTYSADMPEW